MAHRRRVRSQFAVLSLTWSLCLLHFDCENLVVQLRSGGLQCSHRSRQADVAAEGTNLHHEFVAFLKELYLALGGKRQENANLIKTVLLPKRIGLLRAGH